VLFLFVYYNSAAKVYCRFCSWAWVIYDSRDGYKQQCVTAAMIPTIRQESPQTLAYYAQLCDSRGDCECDDPYVVLKGKKVYL